MIWRPPDSAGAEPRSGELHPAVTVGDCQANFATMTTQEHYHPGNCELGCPPEQAMPPSGHIMATPYWIAALLLVAALVATGLAPGKSRWRFFP